MDKILVLPLLALALTLSACGEKTTETSAAKPAEQTAPAATPNAPPQATEQLAANGGHPGQAIHDANCISCHDSGVYTRADRKMTNLEMLTGQVRRCDANLGTKLFDEDLDKVTAFLNETYYKFPK
jgi:mono/diheme cytochrome c family protein